MRTNEALWERIKRQVIDSEVAGTSAGQWSARKAQMAVRLYKEAGGEYKGKKPSSLVKWTNEHWTTKSGLPSHLTGERYLPQKAIENLTEQDYHITSELKRKAMEAGEQYSKQPNYIAEIVKPFRN
jgi:hypothetical protein